MTQSSQKAWRQEVCSSIQMMSVVGLSLLLPMLSACSGSKQEQEKVVFTQLNELLTTNDHPCHQSLIDVGNELIGNKNHYLTLISLPVTDQADESSAQASQQSRADDTREGNLILSGVLEYNDRPSHVRFEAFLLNDIPSEKDQCVVSYQLDYHFDSPCIAIREEAFKKWNKIGDLGDKTQYYVHKRHPDKKAYLTNLNRNTQCLASVHQLKKLS